MPAAGTAATASGSRFGRTIANASVISSSATPRMLAATGVTCGSCRCSQGAHERDHTGSWPVRWWTSWSVSRVLFPGASRRSRSATIHLGVPSPARSSGSPAGSGGPPSNACAHRRHTEVPSRSLSTLLRVGFTEPHRSPGTLVVSYTTVSPLPRGPPGPEASAGHVAVCFLWHCPAARAGLPLTTTLPCGARTFLGGPTAARWSDAVARPTRPGRTLPASVPGALGTWCAGRPSSGAREAGGGDRRVTGALRGGG